jgi:hypothetical protein
LEHADELGIGAERAESFASAATRAAAAYAEAMRARDVAQQALAAARAAMLDARRQGGRIITMVRLVAEQHADATAILNLAAVRSARTPATPNRASERLTPSAPTHLRATLVPQTGAIELTFKARQPSSLGTVTYRVQRAVMREHPQIGTTTRERSSDASAQSTPFAHSTHATHAQSTSDHDHPAAHVLHWEDIGIAGANPHAAGGVGSHARTAPALMDTHAAGDAHAARHSSAAGHLLAASNVHATTNAAHSSAMTAGTGRKLFIDHAPRPDADGIIRYRLIAQCGWRTSGPSHTLLVHVPINAPERHDPNATHRAGAQGPASTTPPKAARPHRTAA